MTLTSEAQSVADRVITALAGPDAALREDQVEAVAELVRPGGRALVVQRTGWGKSAVYWVATAIIRAAGGGPTLIVSPLLSLMRDQVAAAERGGLSAATLNSGNVDEWQAIEQRLHSGDLDVLLVSPERLANPGFGRRVLDSLTSPDGAGLGLVVIDEAHAISDWGHDFRPDYRRVATVLNSLGERTAVLATTATANARVTEDVSAQLGEATLVQRGPLARKSLQLNVIDGLTPLQRYAWVAEQLPRLDGSGIVYVLTVADAQRLVNAIQAVHGPDYPVAAYTGGLDPDERHRLEDALLDNRVKALVATSALGMGFDKPDLGFVLHVGAPPSPVSYYQQVGRAGRALESALVALLHSPTDEAIWDHFATATIPVPEQMTRLLAALAEAGEPQSVPRLEAETGIRRGRIELMLKQLAVDGAAERQVDGWVTTGAPWHYDAEHYDGIVEVRNREAAIMRAFVHSESCLMRLLTESLDDPAADDCGRCSVCVGRLSEPLTDTVDPATLTTITATLRRSRLILEPRKMWPGGAFGARGRIPAEFAAEAGRVLAHADAPEWRDVLAAARGGDAAALDEIAEAAVATLAAWGREAGIRPGQIVSLDTAGGSLAAEIAERLRQVGRRPGGALSLAPGDPPGREATGATEAAYWREHLQVPADVSAGGPVLLVTDASTTGWPITVAAAALRDAGAPAVLPLLIHRTV